MRSLPPKWKVVWERTVLRPQKMFWILFLKRINQTLQSFGNILKLTFSVQHLMFVNFYSLILLSVDSVMRLCPFCNRRIINVRWWWWWWRWWCLGLRKLRNAECEIQATSKMRNNSTRIFRIFHCQYSAFRILPLPITVADRVRRVAMRTLKSSSAVAKRPRDASCLSVVS